MITEISDINLIELLKQDRIVLEHLVKENPNDMELGRKVRSWINRQNEIK